MNLIKSSIKYFKANKILALINLVGLATAFCVCFLVLLYVKFELSYDDYNKKADRIYRLVTDVKTPNGINLESSSAPMAQAVKDNFPQVEETTRIFLDYLIVQSDKNSFGEENIAYADSSLFTVFTLPLVSGNPSAVLNEPFQVVLSETYAHKYFGSADPIGKPLLLDGKFPATVTGVMKDMPNNSHVRTEILVSMATLLKSFNPGRADNWKAVGVYTYILLKKGADASSMTGGLQRLVNEKIADSQIKYEVKLEPLKSVYLSAAPRGYRTGTAVTGTARNIAIFSLVGILTLVIAAFNFINLTTAFSLKRAKEIGLRKVMGASRKQLIVQLLTDALLIAIVAFVITMIVSTLILPLFNEVAGKIICKSILQQPADIVSIFTVAVLTGLLSALYPAIVLSGSKPADSFKNQFVLGKKGKMLRQSLVVAQFSISVVLIVSTIVIYSQLHYMQNEELGFGKKHHLVVDFHFDDRIRIPTETVKRKLSEVPGVEAISYSSSIPGKANIKVNTTIENSYRELQEENLDFYSIDHDFISQYEIALLAGRNFSKQISSDSTKAILINETAARQFGYADADSAINKRYSQRSSKGKIIGVINDFHFQSFEEKIHPLVLTINPPRFTFLTISISGANLTATITNIKERYERLAPGLPFIYYFADEAFNAQYRSQASFGKLFTALTIMALCISCLGLLGLSFFTISQRTKEIGIRKVLGASVAGITAFLSKDFLKLVAISCFIAFPVAWWVMHNWLQNYAYRITLQWWIFLIAGLTAIIIALLTVGFQSLKAAMGNPAKSLRTE